MRVANSFVKCAGLAIVLGVAVLASSPSGATGDEHWDAEFGVPGAGGNGLGQILVEGTNLVVCGAFTSIDGILATNLARWDGREWSPIPANLGPGFGQAVYTILRHDGQLYAGGRFNQIGGVNATNIARWDGTNWFPLGAGVNGLVVALASQGSTLYAGGNFTMAGGMPALRLGRWDGTNWYSMGSFTNYNPNCNDDCFDDGGVGGLAVRGHELYVSGLFVYAGNIFANNIAKWDGTNWSALGPGLSDGAGPMVFIGNNLFVGGAFRTAGGLTVNSVARWDGDQWHDLAGGVSGPPTVRRLATSGNDLYAGGGFQSIGGVTANRIAKWDGTNWSALGSGLGSALGDGARTLVSNGSELFVGGYFNVAGGKPSTNIALWHIPHPLRAERVDGRLVLSWPATGTNLTLEASQGLGPCTSWLPVSPPPVCLGQDLVVTQDFTGSTRFYRVGRR